jgi:hypothetical protein
VGAFAFFAAFSIYVLLAKETAPRRAFQFLFLAGVTPLLVSIGMFAISVFRLGTFCKTCIGLYVASALLAVAGAAAFLQERRAENELARAPRPPEPPRPAPGEAPPAGSEGVPGTLPDPAVHAGVPTTVLDERKVPGPRRLGGFLLIPTWLAVLGLFSIAPALIYVGALPSYAGYVSGCGKLEKPTEPNNALLRVTPPGATQPATLFVDPLCPTCKALHQRLEAEQVMNKLDVTLVLFPLDSDCNWMLDRPLHPGACLVSKAILCSEHRAMQVLEWAYDNQEDLLAAAKAGAGLVNVRAMIRERWPGLEACIESKETNLRLNRTLRFIVNNHLPVSTPQMYLGDTRVCDEDTDMGLAYAMRKLAPALEARSR